MQNPIADRTDERILLNDDEIDAVFGAVLPEVVGVIAGAAIVLTAAAIAYDRAQQRDYAPSGGVRTWDPGPRAELKS